MIWLRFLTYMWRIVQEEGALILDGIINELRRKFAVSLLKLQEICGLLLDILIKHERHSYHTLITEAIALHIWRKAGEILTGTLWYRDKGIYLKYYYAMMREINKMNIRWRTCIKIYIIIMQCNFQMRLETIQENIITWSCEYGIPR